MKLIVFAALVFISVFHSNGLCAQVSTPFSGKVTAEKINIRIDSTVSSEKISSIDKGEGVEVVSELYDWYKIRLPKNSPSFIKKNLVTAVEDKPADSFDKLKDSSETQNRIAKVTADKVNIRLSPSESSPILGKAAKDEVITILEDKGAWYRIEPINNSFGWINKKFVEKSVIEKKPETVPVDNNVTVEGVIRPYGMIFKRPATHKLVTAEEKVFLLKGNKKSLDALNYHKVRIIGKYVSQDTAKLPVIEIERVEGLD